MLPVVSLKNKKTKLFIIYWNKLFIPNQFLTGPRKSWRKKELESKYQKVVDRKFV